MTFRLHRMTFRLRPCLCLFLPFLRLLWMALALAGFGWLWLWLALAGFGCLWLALAAFGWLWLALAGSGCLWLALAAFGRLWLASALRCPKMETFLHQQTESPLLAGLSPALPQNEKFSSPANGIPA